MNRSSKLIEREYRKVKSTLSDKLSIAIANGERELIFAPQSHTTIKGLNTIRSFRKKLKKELRSVPQVKEVKVNRLKNLYKCTCHNGCISINAKFRPEKLKCGKSCSCLSLFCHVDVPWCQRRDIKQRLKINDRSIVMRIALDPDYSPPKKKSIKKRRRKDRETPNDNHIV